MRVDRIAHDGDPHGAFEIVRRPEPESKTHLRLLRGLGVLASIGSIPSLAMTR
jgi:hypothetical protein